MVSYFKTQWWRLLVALGCLVVAAVFAFSPAPDTSTIEGTNAAMGIMLAAQSWFLGFVVWSIASLVHYQADRIELLEKKAEKYDALVEEVHALYEANRIDREHMKLLEQKINQLKYDKENPV